MSRLTLTCQTINAQVPPIFPLQKGHFFRPRKTLGMQKDRRTAQPSRLSTVIIPSDGPRMSAALPTVVVTNSSNSNIHFSRFKDVSDA
jgi:hypothetical protein